LSLDIDQVYNKGQYRAFSVPWYIDLHHARLLNTGENDPLVTIVFEKIDEFG